jgi:predicted RNA-binding protein YlqC (UPF0109 family)
LKSARTPQQVNISLRVNKDDMGRIIGKGGKVANAMRVLLRVAAVQEGSVPTWISLNLYEAY